MKKGNQALKLLDPLKIGNNNYLLNRGWVPFDKKDR